MIITVIIIIACFIGLIILIITGKLNRAIASLAGAVISYLALVFLEGYDYSLIVDLLFGTQVEGYVNLHSLVLIISMMLIVEISHQAGTFQFIAGYLIKLSKGKPILLMIILCCVTVLISAILNNILTVIIMIPLIITISRMLNINPSPYILTQAILVNVGGTIFMISSIPNILITNYANIEFVEFFLNVGLVSLVIFVFTLILFILLYKDELKVPEESSNVLKEYNVWNVIQNKRLLVQSLTSLIVLFILFVFIPSSIISSDILALSVALILTIISKLDPKEILSKVDLELIFYLIGVFIITGGLEIMGATNIVGDMLLYLGAGIPILQLIMVLWISAYFSSAIDNIPITKVLIPVVGDISESVSSSLRKKLFYSMAFGTNWGDNLTPLGDNILVVNIAQQNKRPISIKQFFKLGFVVTNYQLALITVYYLLVFNLGIGIITVTVIAFLVAFMYFMNFISQKKKKIKINQFFIKIRNAIIR